MRRGLLVFLVLAFHLPSLSRTVIVTGWDVCTAPLDEILESADLFAATPIDGIAFNLRVADKKGKSHSSGHPAESPFVWTREMLAGDVPKLRKMVSHKGLTESIVGITTLFLESIQVSTNVYAQERGLRHIHIDVCTEIELLVVRGIVNDKTLILL